MTLRTCRKCGSNLDPEERCDCEKERMEESMRTPAEIREEIKKVERARTAAKVKKARCDDRLDELAEELLKAESKSA